jgi:SWI/SNF-related matrix-associated actin-dependent regulator of chromatin subfamily A3
MARASCSVHATNGWAIIGIPIQNRVTDFASLLEYLQVYPFSIPKVFDEKITRPWLKSNERDFSPMKKLVRCVSLCRTKAIIDLPQRRDLVIYLNFSPEEQDLYNKVKDTTIKKFDDALASNPTQAGQYINALQWLNELRLLCSHGLVHSERNGHKSLKITPRHPNVEQIGS